MSLLFGLYPLRFCFEAKEPVYFPQGKSANILRGAFGHMLRRRAGYERLFEPSARLKAERGPSGLGQWPRPFVFRASHLDGCGFDPGAPFYFDFHLFDLNSPAIPAVVRAFRVLEREGVGPRRARVELTGVWQLDRNREAFKPLEENTSPLAIELAPPIAQVKWVRIRFLTPTELKSGNDIAARPEFGVLATRIRDRISALRALYGWGPLEIDFREFGERAGRIRMTGCNVRRVSVVRRSSRTGQTHSIGGFAGEAEYKGELTEFVPYLWAAEWTGVGRQTVWGKGQISVVCLG